MWKKHTDLSILCGMKIAEIVLPAAHMSGE